MAEQSVTLRVDARGQLCPLPVLKLRKALNAVEPGDCVELRATDAAAWNDVAAYCAETGERLLERRDEAGVLVFVVVRSSAAQSA